MTKTKYYKHPGGVLGLPRKMIRSPAYKKLKPVARALIIELQDVWKPHELGIHFSVRRAAEKLGVSIGTASRAFDKLNEHGFIQCTEESDWFNGKAREWHLTWLTINNREPTNEYLDWKEK